MLGHHGFPWKLTNYHVLLQVQHHNRKQLPLVSTAVPFPTRPWSINMGLVHTQAEAPAHWSRRRQVRPFLTPACEHCGQSTSALILPLFL